MSRILCALVVAAVVGCGGGQSEAIKRGVGSECNADLKCTEMGQTCLPEFAGGYCGVAGCQHDTDCPGGSACVIDSDNGMNYCFLVCVDKTDCNAKRSAANESSCVSSLTFVDGTMNRKVCRPPLSGSGPVDASTD